ncbi:bromodomain-containing protein 8 [Topomyia yanbarensis]|uniref:bromodomain-containing protein 8 n=1 Tax=Topomyia yanbarensis TaxID=2498891 RepID=UPI00273AA2C7|nr:bromodomain-containing protein 8 [Topomyia yanbarensis]
MSNVSSVQERLQLKRVPLDKWSIKEKLCLASAVACSGDQNWMSVSRSLKMLCGANRPGDWFSQKSCAAQYGKLLENVETPKRKKRTASERDGVSAVETPGESILRKLTQERIIELKKIIQDEAQQYTKVKEDIILIQSGVTDEKKLREMWKQIETEKAQKEKEQVLHAQWLKEREEKKLELERQWRPMFPSSPSANKGSGTIIKIKEEIDEDSQSSPKSGTSPLLTSLLKSPTASSSNNPLLQTPRSASSPTITNLLTGNSPITMNIQGKNLFPTTNVVSNQQSQNSPLKAQTLEENKSNIQESSYRTAPNLTKLLDTKNQENESENLMTSTSNSKDLLQEEQSTEKSEDMEIDSDNVDPAKDLMAVFQELMPEELDDILNENDGMILEDEILENVVDSIMEDDAESTKGKDLNVLEATSNASSFVEEQKHDTPVPKNESTSPEIVEETCLKLATAESPPPVVVAESPIALPQEEVVKSADISDKVVDTQEKESNQCEEGIAQNETQSVTKDNEPNATDDGSNSTTDTDLAVSKDNAEEPKPTIDSGVTDMANVDESSNISKEEADDNSEDKPLASLDLNLLSTKTIEVKSEESMDIKEECSESALSDCKPVPSAQDNTPHEIQKNLSDEEEAARAKKEALEKLAAEYDFKDDEEPIVPLSIQKSKDEKHVQDEDVFMDAQEHLDEPEEQKESNLKKIEEPVVAITDTDDDSLIEMKISKTKRDYSRRRPVEDSSKPKDEQQSTPKSDEIEGRTLRKLRDRDRSESPFILLDDDVNDKMKRSYSSTPVMDSIPSSPASSEDRDYRAWKKAILSIHSKISSLRYASAFLKPLPEEHVTDLIYKPMDLSKIKRNIENGNIRTTAEYQRDIMLVCTNAIILNRVELCSPTAARVLLKESVALIDATMEVGRQSRDKGTEHRSESGNKRSSRKGTTRSSTSITRN